MNEDRRRILTMLAEGKITSEEAERLLDALGARADPPASAAARSRAKYMRIEVDAVDQDGPTKVNIRVPLQLLRAGVRLSALMPAKARNDVDAAMTANGVPFTLSQLRPENLEEIVDSLGDLTMDVDSDGAKVRIHCE